MSILVSLAIATTAPMVVHDFPGGGQASTAISATPEALWAALERSPHLGFAVVERVPPQRLVWRRRLPLGLYTETRTFTLVRPDEDYRTTLTAQARTVGPWAAWLGPKGPAMAAFVRDVQRETSLP